MSKKITDEKNVFISHHKKDEKHVEKLKKMLKKHGCEAKNYSITSEKENQASNKDYIKQTLSKHMKPASVIICLIGKETYKREFVNWEIKHASREGKIIIGMYINKLCNPISSDLERYADSIINWDIKKLLDAMNGEKNFCNLDGSTRSKNPLYKTVRVVCKK